MIISTAMGLIGVRTVQVKKVLLAFVLIILGVRPVLGQPFLEGVFLRPGSQGTEIRIKLSQAVHDTVFTLSNPNRLVIDLRGTVPRLSGLPPGTGLVRDVRMGQHTHMLRLVFDLRQAVLPQSFDPTGPTRNDLVLNLEPRVRDPEPVVSLDQAIPRIGPVVVCLDPGHGGIDSGAIGPNGLMEKIVTLSVGLDVRALLKGIPGLRVVMTRTGDYYVGLRQRREICERAHGNVFVAIHADSYPVRAIDGATVFALSQHGATDAEARWLAHSENSVERIYGHVYSVNLKDKSRVLREVLLNLAQSATIHQSLRLGDDVIGDFSRWGVPLHRETVAQANCAVLRDPDVPSILIECGFISNPWQAHELADPAFRERIAHAIAQGILSYLHHNRRTETVLVDAARDHSLRYVVQAGDTLDGIALRYHVPADEIRSDNHLSNANLFSGQVLTIPVQPTGAD